MDKGINPILFSCMILPLLTGFLIYPLNAQQMAVETITGRKIAVAELERFITLQMDSLEVPGLSLAVINNKSVVYAGNFGVKNLLTGEQVNQHTLFEACSLSKPLFAYFVLKFVQRGALGLDTPVYTYFMDREVDYSDSGYKALTARMVLNHCSGWPNWRDAPGDLLEFSFKPGSQSRYSGEGYQYLKRVLNYLLDVSDIKLNDYFLEEVTRTLNAEPMSFVWQDSMKVFKAYGHRNGVPTDNGPHGSPDLFDAAAGLHTTAGGYAKFIAELMDPNNALNQALLELQTSLPPESDGLYRSLGFPYKPVAGEMRFYHSGNNGDTRSYCHFYREKGIGLVLFGNSDNFFSSGFVAKMLEFLDEEYPY
ncbi:CubicO group peptidase (beta-lactamase class C family) [Algoriphagus sp. 4150]|uniref:serine hydrolase domain-containing protein n=1 Tax=Algoriphagus sp. 4150 TaxID=2817756 RepID=UPI00285B36B2|nr:serine hydrolase domain-containing protein [Algoriphagus sp. 4150]MDR7132782.1 CubicO group peptidase (beta-lactamase class C family) [Algoriphagus sp. 4150]